MRQMYVNPRHHAEVLVEYMIICGHVYVNVLRHEKVLTVENATRVWLTIPEYLIYTPFLQVHVILVRIMELIKHTQTKQNFIKMSIILKYF